VISIDDSGHLNTPRRITDSDGNTVWQWDGEAFGNTPPTAETTGAGPFVFNLRFPGQYADAEIGLFYNYFRMYDPAIGRYDQSDPLELYGGSHTTFSYAASNPNSFSDSLGLAVNVTINTKTGIITVTDTTTNQSASAFGFTGSHDPQATDPMPWRETALPNGTYWLTQNVGPANDAHADWYSVLEQKDNVDDSFNDNGTTRHGARFHSGGFSWGCVTVDKYKDSGNKNWQAIQQLIQNTSTTQIMYNPGSRWYQLWSQPAIPITVYGTVTVK